MAGYSKMLEVMLWVQTFDEADVKIAYWIKDSSLTKQYTDEVTTEKSSVFPTHLIASVLESGLVLMRSIYGKDGAKLWDYKIN